MFSGTPCIVYILVVFALYTGNIPLLRVIFNSVTASEKEFTKILLISETYPRPIRDPLETNNSDRKPLGDQHA